MQLTSPAALVDAVQRKLQSMETPA
jgi:hypothetical protein